MYLMTTKDKILQSALRLFLLHGYEAVSIADIVKQAAVSKGALYNYFPSKENLFLQTMQQLFSEFGKSMQADFGQQAFDSFHAFYLAFADHYDQVLNDRQPNLSDQLILMTNAARAFPRLKQVVSEQEAVFVAFWRNNIQRAMASGELRTGLPATELSHVYLNLVRGVVIDLVIREHNSRITKGLLKERFDTIYMLLKKEN